MSMTCGWWVGPTALRWVPDQPSTATAETPTSISSVAKPVVVAAPDDRADRSADECAGPPADDRREHADVLPAGEDQAGEAAEEQADQCGGDHPPEREADQRQHDEQDEQRAEDPQDHASQRKPV